jgi:hypothetical protein
MTFSLGFFSTIVVGAIGIAALAAFVLPALFIRDARHKRIW